MTSGLEVGGVNMSRGWCHSRLSRTLACIWGLAIVAPTSTGHAIPCAQSLTFRWTSGDGIELDVLHPPPEALQNQPFLRDPEILWTRQGHDVIGPKLTFKLGPEAAAVFAVETASHRRHQLLIMLGDTVLVAAMVWERLDAEIELQGPEDDPAYYEQLANTLMRRPGCRAENLNRIGNVEAKT